MIQSVNSHDFACNFDYGSAGVVTEEPDDDSKINGSLGVATGISPVKSNQT